MADNGARPVRVMVGGRRVATTVTTDENAEIVISVERLGDFKLTSAQAEVFQRAVDQARVRAVLQKRR